MRHAATEALGYAETRARADLNQDRMLLRSLVRCLEIVGEAAANMSPDAREQLPDIPWSAMVGMRNRLIQAYFDINLAIVWRTMVDELPVLVEKVDAALAAAGWEPPAD